MSRMAIQFLFVCIWVLLSGCAFDVTRVTQIPTTLEKQELCEGRFVLGEDVGVQPQGGHYRTLEKGTEWKCVGQITQGDVYATRDQVLTLEGSNIFEAYIVVSSKNLVGFYLPVERAFSPVTVIQQLPMQETI